MQHIYRYYKNLNITVCQNCAKFKTDIEKQDHHLYEHGYCDPGCARCAAETCNPPALTFIKPV